MAHQMSHCDGLLPTGMAGVFSSAMICCGVNRPLKILGPTKSRRQAIALAAATWQSCASHLLKHMYHFKPRHMHWRVSWRAGVQGKPWQVHDQFTSSFVHQPKPIAVSGIPQAAKQGIQKEFQVRLECSFAKAGSNRRQCKEDGGTQCVTC